MFNTTDLENIKTALRNKKLMKASELKDALQTEQASRHVANLAHELREVEEDETYFTRILLPERSLFQMQSTRHLGTLEDDGTLKKARAP